MTCTPSSDPRPSPPLPPPHSRCSKQNPDPRRRSERSKSRSCAVAELIPAVPFGCNAACSALPPTCLHAAAEQLVGRRIVDALDRRANQTVPGVTHRASLACRLRMDLASALAAETGRPPVGCTCIKPALGRDSDHRRGQGRRSPDSRNSPEPAASTRKTTAAWPPASPPAIQADPWTGMTTCPTSLRADHRPLPTTFAITPPRGQTQPGWAPPGRPSSAKGRRRDRAVRRAANSIDPRDISDPPDQPNFRLRRSNCINTSSKASPMPTTNQPNSMSRGGKPQRELSEVASTTSIPPAPSLRGPPWAATTEPRPIEEAATGRCRTGTVAASRFLGNKAEKTSTADFSSQMHQKARSVLCRSVLALLRAARRRISVKRRTIFF